MKYVDTAIQTLLILGAVVALVAGFFQPDMLFFFAIAQFFLGVWQVLGCIISLIVYPEGNESRRKHLTISGIYLITLILLGNQHHGIPGWLIIAYGTVPAWSLGIYYYSITLRWAFPQLKQGKFLPHISF